MKNRILVLLLFAFLAQVELKAQNCTSPPDCILNPGIDGSGKGWGDQVGTTLPNWGVLSGNPIYAQGVIGSNGFRLTNGDGMRTCFRFLAGVAYRVCFLGYTTNGQNGNVVLEANNGSGGNQVINTVTVTQHGPNPVNYATTFTASGNFNELRLFVNSAGTSVVIDDVGIIEVVAISATPATIYTGGSSTLAVTANTLGNMNVTWSPTPTLTPPVNQSQVTASPCYATQYTATYSSRCSPMYSCNTNTAQVIVTVLPNGSIVNNSDALCAGFIDLQYAPIVPYPGLTYEWYGPTGTLLSTSSTFFKSPSHQTDEGIYTLKVKTPNGCTDVFTTNVIKDCCRVTADFSEMDCNPVRFVNNTLDKDGNPALRGEWFWDFGDGTTSTLRNPSHLYINHRGLTTVCLTTVITDGFSTCCDRVCKDITVCDFACAAKAAFDFEVTDPNARDIQLFDKSVGIGNACVWNWVVDGIPIPGNSNPNPVVNGLLPGTHTICLDVEFCHPFGPNCVDAGWCEEIEIQ